MSDTFASVPAELKARPQWVCWKRETSTNGKPTKKPKNPKTGQNADTTNQTDWTDFDTAVSASTKSNMSGIGYVFTPNDGLVGVDIDNCRNENTGHIEEWAWEIIRQLNTYTEVSPSQTGVKLWLKAKKPEPGRKCSHETGAVETYGSKRYFTVTGQHLDGTPTNVEERSGEYAVFYFRVFPQEVTLQSPAEWLTRKVDTFPDDFILEKARNAKNGDKFRTLYDDGDISAYSNDSSRADLALCGLLAFYAGKEGYEQVDRLFRSSALMRDKWYKPTNGSTWGHNCILKAYEKRTEFYKPMNGLKRPCTDEGNAERFVDMHGENVRFCHTSSTWLIWDGVRWKADKDGEVYRLSKETIREIHCEVRYAKDDDEHKAILKWAYRSQDGNKDITMLRKASSARDVAVTREQLDQNEMLLGVQNGTIDLQTGTFRASSREDLITKQCPVEYNADAQCLVWNRFLERVVPDGRTRAYLQRCIGYALTGSVSEQAIFFLYGTGANGKSTFLNVLLDLFGDYGMQAAAELLMQQKHEKHTTERTDLDGKRLVCASETPDGIRLNEAFVKTLTGGERIRARKVYQDSCEFAPTHKIFLATNYKPVIRGTDEGIWRRIRLIEFGAQIPDHERDSKLSDKLRAELPGILNWAIEGCSDWQRQDGLRPPEAVQHATEEYRAEEDILGRFITDCCFVKEGALTTAASLYNAYMRWCGEEGILVPLTKTMFGKQMKPRGFQGGNLGGPQTYKGIALQRFVLEEPAGKPSEQIKI